MQVRTLPFVLFVMLSKLPNELSDKRQRKRAKPRTHLGQRAAAYRLVGVDEEAMGIKQSSEPINVRTREDRANIAEPARKSKLPKRAKKIWQKGWASSSLPPVSLSSYLTTLPNPRVAHAARNTNHESPHPPKSRHPPFIE